MAFIFLVLFAYYPVLQADFIWDDVINVTQNVSLRSLRGLWNIWHARESMQQFYPLASTSYWLDYQIWGLKPFGYHAENVLLHALGVVLLWHLLKRLKVPGSQLGAALFALHPVCVESVAWVTERRNVLSGVFCLGSILASLNFWLPDLTLPKPADMAGERVEGPASSTGLWRYYWLALIFYVCALWSKTAAVGIPVVIPLLVWWKRGNLGKRSLWLLAPFFLVGMMMALITIHIEGHVGAAAGEWHGSLLQRCLLPGRIVCFYLYKLLWPHPLMIFYPRWTISITQLSSYLSFLALGVCLWFLWRKRDDWGRPILVAAGCFAAMLFPVMGFFNVAFFRFSFVSDHFQYLACIAPLALAGAGITAAFDRLGPRFAVLNFTICGTLLLALGVLTWRQTHIYLSDETLWSAGPGYNPESWAAQNNLGGLFLRQRKPDEAIPHFIEALRLSPDPMGPDGYLIQRNLAFALVSEGRLDEAVEHYRRALTIDPKSVEALNALASLLALSPNPGTRNGAEAVRLAERACQLTNYREAICLGTLGAAYAEAGRFEDAVNASRKAQALAEESGDKKLADKNRRMVILFGSRQPFREQPAP